MLARGFMPSALVAETLLPEDAGLITPPGLEGAFTIPAGVTLAVPLLSLTAPPGAGDAPLMECRLPAASEVLGAEESIDPRPRLVVALTVVVEARRSIGVFDTSEFGGVTKGPPGLAVRVVVDVVEGLADPPPESRDERFGRRLARPEVPLVVVTDLVVVLSFSEVLAGAALGAPSVRQRISGARASAVRFVSAAEVVRAMPAGSMSRR